MAFGLAWIVAILAAISCPAINAHGTQVSISEIPSIVQIEVRVGTLWLQQCVGSVLTSVHILGPASAFSGSLYLAENRRIRAGSSTRGNDGSVVAVGIATNHPNYGSAGSDSDISVVRLASNLILGSSIAQASIVSQGFVFPPGIPVQAYGFGKTIQGGEISNGNLHRAGLILTAPCGDSFDDSEVTGNMICASLPSGGLNYDARDLGAPVVYNNVVVGILSFGGENKPVVGAAVSSFTNWIVANAV